MPKAPKEPKESKDSKERHAPHDIATRVHALALKVNGFTDKDILDQTGVASRTIRHIYSRARKRGFDPDKSKRIELRFIEDGKRTGRPRKDANVGKPGDLQPHLHVDATASDDDGPSQLSPVDVDVDGSSSQHHAQLQLQLQQPSHPRPPPQPQSVDDHAHQHQHSHPHPHPHPHPHQHQHQHQHQHPHPHPHSNPQADQHPLMEPALQQPLQPLPPHHHHHPKYLDTDPTAHHLDHHPWDAPPQHPATMHSMDLEAQLRDGLRASLNPQHPVIQMSEAAVDPSLRGHDMPVYQPPNAP